MSARTYKRPNYSENDSILAWMKGKSPDSNITYGDVSVAMKDKYHPLRKWINMYRVEQSRMDSVGGRRKKTNKNIRRKTRKNKRK